MHTSLFHRIFVNCHTMSKKLSKQARTRKHSSRMRTARFCSSGGYTLHPWMPDSPMPYSPDTLPLSLDTLPLMPQIPPPRKGPDTRDNPPPEQTDACKNITFPQLMLRVVKIINIPFVVFDWSRTLTF